MSNAIILQGRYTSTGNDIIVPLRSGVDWFQTWNLTSIGSPVNTDVKAASWQFGFPAASAMCTVYVSASTADNLTYHNGTGGFTYIDSSIQTPGVTQNTITAISTAASPVVTNSGTNGLVAGNIVRLSNCAGGATGLNGIDFVVGSTSLSSTTFQLQSAVQLSVAGTTGSFTLINYDPIYYPRHRVITAMVDIGVTTTIATSVPHGYQVGQQIRLNIPSNYGTSAIFNGVQVTVLEVSSSVELIVDLDMSGFTFAFPSATSVAFTPAIIVPIGENTAYANAQMVNVLTDSTVNEAEIGMLIDGGATQPGGAADDQIYWQAGVSFSIDNQ